MSSKINLLDTMKESVIDLINDLERAIILDDQEQGEIIILRLFFTRMQPDAIMNIMIKKVLPHKSQIDDRSKKFWKNDALFSNLPGQRSKHYQYVLSDDPRLDEDDRDMVWCYFDLFVDIGEAYKKNN